MKTTKAITTRQELDALVQEFTNSTGMISLDKDDMSYLYDEKEILEVRITASSSDGEDRADAVCREFKEGDYTAYDKVLMSIRYSEQHPLMMDDMNKVNEMMELFPGDFAIKWGLGIDNTLGDQIKVVVILSK